MILFVFSVIILLFVQFTVLHFILTVILQCLPGLGDVEEVVIVIIIFMVEVNMGDQSK